MILLTDWKVDSLVTVIWEILHHQGMNILFQDKNSVKDIWFDSNLRPVSRYKQQIMPLVAFYFPYFPAMLGVIVQMCEFLLHQFKQSI